eukprot:gene4093-biopygen2604
MAMTTQWGWPGRMDYSSTSGGTLWRDGGSLAARLAAAHPGGMAAVWRHWLPIPLNFQFCHAVQSVQFSFLPGDHERSLELAPANSVNWCCARRNHLQFSQSVQSSCGKVVFAALRQCWPFWRQRGGSDSGTGGKVAALMAQLAAYWRHWLVARRQCGATNGIRRHVAAWRHSLAAVAALRRHNLAARRHYWRHWRHRLAAQCRWRHWRHTGGTLAAQPTLLVPDPPLTCPGRPGQEERKEGTPLHIPMIWLDSSSPPHETARHTKQWE